MQFLNNSKDTEEIVIRRIMRRLDRHLDEVEKTLNGKKIKPASAPKLEPHQNVPNRRTEPPSIPQPPLPVLLKPPPVLIEVKPRTMEALPPIPPKITIVSNEKLSSNLQLTEKNILQPIPIIANKKDHSNKKTELKPDLPKVKSAKKKPSWLPG